MTHAKHYSGFHMLFISLCMLAVLAASGCSGGDGPVSEDNSNTGDAGDTSDTGNGSVAICDEYVASSLEELATTGPRVVFDPANARLPLPSTLALEEDGTQPARPGAGDSSAQGDYRAYLDGLHGWLPSETLTIPIDGDIDANTLTPDAVALFELNDDDAVRLHVDEVRFDSASGQLVIVPERSLSLATDYGYVVTEQVRDPQGSSLVPPRPLLTALASEPLVVDGQPQSAILPDDVTLEEAVELEEVRTLMRPLVDAALRSGLACEEIRAMSLWHTARDSFAAFPPAGGGFPAASVGSDGTVQLPADDGADAWTSAIVDELNTRAGFPVTTGAWFEVNGLPLDPATVEVGAIDMAYVSGSATLYPGERYDLAYAAELGVLSLTPLKLPLELETNAVIVTDQVQDVHGQPLKPSPAFVLVRSTHPLFADGRSTVEEFDDEDAEALEAVRQAYQRFFLAAMSVGHTERNSIASAWAFDTEDPTRPQRESIAKAVALADQRGLLDASGDPADATASPSGYDHVGLLQSQATFTTLSYLDASADGGLLDDPVQREVAISIALPDQSSCGAGPYSISIAVHGYGAASRDATDAIADALAASPHCVATVALDLPAHGARATAGAASGEDFLSADAVSTKNYLLQSVVDIALLTEVIASGGLEGVIGTSGDLIDPSRIGLVGYDLGATVGAIATATVDEISVAALSGPSAHLVEFLLDGGFSAQFLPQLPAHLSPGSREFLEAMTLFQWVIEQADPWVFAHHVRAEPFNELTYDSTQDQFIEGSPHRRAEVVVQMADQDDFVPPSTTVRLADAIGVSLDDTTFDTAGPLVTGDSTHADCARRQIASWLSSGLGGQARLGTDQQGACGLAP
jgi:hypothetical protein